MIVEAEPFDHRSIPISVCHRQSDRPQPPGSEVWRKFSAGENATTRRKRLRTCRHWASIRHPSDGQPFQAGAFWIKTVRSGTCGKRSSNLADTTVIAGSRNLMALNHAARAGPQTARGPVSRPRRIVLRGWRSQDCGGSNPPFRTNQINNLRTRPDLSWDFRLVHCWDF